MRYDREWRCSNRAAEIQQKIVVQRREHYLLVFSACLETGISIICSPITLTRSKVSVIMSCAFKVHHISIAISLLVPSWLFLLPLGHRTASVPAPPGCSWSIPFQGTMSLLPFLPFGSSAAATRRACISPCIVRWTHLFGAVFCRWTSRPRMSLRMCFGSAAAR